MPPEQLANLRALAAKATRGPWRYDGRDIEQLTDGGQGYPLNVYPDSKAIAICQCEECGRCGGIVEHVDSEYIAAASPDVVLGLLDEVERLQLEHRQNGSIISNVNDAIGRAGIHYAITFWEAIDQIAAERDGYREAAKLPGRLVARYAEIDAQLAAVTAARDELADLAGRYVDDFQDSCRITELMAVGK